VIPVREGLSLAAVGGAVVVAGVPLLAVWCRRRAPAVALGACVATVAYLTTSNLLFASGVVLAERNLYLAVLLVAAAAGTGAVWAANRWGVRRAALAVGVIGLALAARSWLRLPVWESNKSLVLVTLTEHPEAYRARVWAAAVLAGMGDTAGARAQYAIAGELFDRDPYLDAARASYLMGLGDTSTAAPLIARARRAEPRDPFALRAHLLLLRSRGELAGARALADSALGWFPADAAFYRKFLQSLTPKLRPAR
ncbi:MAG: tetratricopeptide repeat protein, partial [Dehalococcoidia bacterium]